MAYSSRGIFINEAFATINMNPMQGVVAAKADGVIAGWYLTCNSKGYNIFCINYNEPTNPIAG
jgi:hypothetical protein